MRPLGAENDKAFALINALDAGQKSKAILNYRVADLVLGPGQDGKTIQPEGIPGSALNASQQTMLLDIVHEWAGIVNDVYAEPRMAAIKAAWRKPTSRGAGRRRMAARRLRIRGPTLGDRIRAAEQPRSHPTIYRDPTNDYMARRIEK